LIGQRRQAGEQVAEFRARGLAGVLVDRGPKSVERAAHGRGQHGQSDPDRRHRLPAGPIPLHQLPTTLCRPRVSRFFPVSTTSVRIELIPASLADSGLADYEVPGRTPTLQ
jgi:hypothetical protein